MTTSTDDAGDAGDAARPGDPSTVVVPTTESGLDVNVRFDRSSVRRSGVILMALVAGLLLALWLYSVLSHFLFLIVLAWLFAIALEPGIRWFIARGRSRGTATAIMGGGAILVALVLAAVFVTVAGLCRLRHQKELPAFDGFRVAARSVILRNE